MTEGPEDDAIAALLRAAGRRPSPSDSEFEPVREAAHAAWQTRVRARRRRRFYGLAASIGAVAVVAGLLFLQPNSPAEVGTVARVIGRLDIEHPSIDALTVAGTGSALIENSYVRTAPDGSAALELDKGISLRVDGGTELTLEAADRIVLHGGTIYVDSGLGVRTDRILVVTELGTFSDVGTQFEVAASTLAVRLRVREGRVEFAAPGLRASLQSAAGDELVVDTGGGVMRTSVSPYDAAWGWAEQLATNPRIDGRSAHEVLQWVAREMGRELVFADAELELKLRKTVLSGPPGDMVLTPAEVLQIAIGTLDGLDYLLRDGYLLIEPG